MGEKDFEYGQFIANMAQLIEDDVHFIVPANNYDVRNDDRLLIPFKQQQKFGFVNRNAVEIVKAQFDIIAGDFYTKDDYVRVGTKYLYGIERTNGEIQTYDRYKWGIIDSNGEFVLEIKYAQVQISDSTDLFSVQEYDKGYCVINRNGEIVVPYGTYSYIDGFTKGYARVKRGDRWGLISSDGSIALPIEYNNIWNFHNKQELNSTKVIKDNHELRFFFSTGKLEDFSHSSNKAYHYRMFDDNDSSTHYGEYEGTYAQDVAGYSDEVIDDAFDGEPDAYWNID